MSQSSRDRYRNSNLNNVLARPAASNAPIGPRFSSGLVPLGGPKRTRSAGAPAAKVTVPKPVNLPSLKKENAGHDPSTQIGALNWDEDERQVSAPLSGRPGATADRAKSFDEDDRPFVRREEPQFRPWEEPHVEGYSSWRGSGREDAAPSYGRSLSADRQREPYGLPRSERDMFGPPQRGPARGPDVEDRWGSRGSQSRDSFGPDRQSDARRPLQDRPLQDRDSFNRGPDYSRFNGPPPARFDRYRSEEYIPAYVEDPTLFPPPPPPRHGSSPRARGGSAQQQAEIGRGEASTHAEDMERQAFLEELDRVAADLEKEQVRKKEEAEAAAAAAAAAAAEAEAAERAAAEEAERKAAAAKLLIAPTSFASVIVPEGEKPPEGTSQAKPRTRFKPLDEEDEEEKQRKAAAAAKLRELEERMAQRAAAAEAERLAKEAAAAAQAAEAAQAEADRGGRGGRGRGRGKGGRDALAKDTVLKDAGAAGERMRGEKAERGRSRGRGARKGARSQNGDNEATLEAEPEEPTHEAPDLTDPRPKKAQRGPGKAEAEPQAGQPGAAAGAAGNARTAPHNAAPNAQVPTRGRNRNAAKNAVARPNANASAPSAAPSHFAWGANLAQEVASIAQLSLEEPITRKNNSLSPMLDPVAPLGPATEGRAVDRPKSAQSGVVSRPRGRTPSQMKSIYVAKTTGDRVNGSQG
ncbi:hypothetical protein WJX72_011357 [[Myrmecia] bisecta]|uniref:BAT2 N-terminal domain-containing protein n=1 Tax=[Myrmecia] bisecta TaxID=41462 RepID=A0AAW1QSX8_9CHLO